MQNGVYFTSTVALCYSIAHMQLELFQFDFLEPVERRFIYTQIRNHYFHLRNLRSAKWGQARRRKHYRLVAAQKKRLLEAGVSKREVLDLLACCRLKCTRHKFPFVPCQFCP